jgi:hypothetical protein
LWAVSYPVRKNLVLDAGFDHGLTSSSTHWQRFAGFTYLLPHRLWGPTTQNKYDARATFPSTLAMVQETPRE